MVASHRFIREDKSKIKAEIEKRMKDVVEEIANLAKKQKVSFIRAILPSRYTSIS